MSSTSTTDRLAPVDEHLGALHSVIRRAALVFLASAALALFWVDGILHDWALSQSPGGALSIYGPYDWVEMRFTAIFIIAAVVTLPIASLDLRLFARPGLLPTERRWLDSFFIISAISLPLILHTVWFKMIPQYIEAGVQFDSIAGVSAHFDAAEIFALASGLSWILILAFMTTLFLSLSRLFGLVEEGRSRFRNRALAICGGTLILTLPEVFEGVRVMTAILVIFLAESISRTTPSGPLGPRRPRVMSMVDSQGISQRPALLACSCEGACPSVETAWMTTDSLPLLNATALCLEEDEQQAVFEVVRSSGITHLTITGCDSAPVPVSLKTNLTASGTQLDGLSWLDDERSTDPAWRKQSLQFLSSRFSPAGDE